MKTAKYLKPLENYFEQELPVRSDFTKEKFYQFVQKNGFEHVIGSIYSKEGVGVAYLDKEVPTIFISGTDYDSPLVQKILNEILPKEE